MKLRLNQSGRFNAKAYSITFGLLFAAGLSLLFFKLNVSNAPSHAATGCTLNAILINPCRPLVGGATRGNPGTPSEIAAGIAPSTDAQTQFNYLANTLVGHNLDVFRDYDTCGLNGTGTSVTCSVGDFPLSSTSSDEYKLATRQNGYIDIDWKPAGQWSQAGGSNSVINNEITQVAKNIKAIAPHKVFLTVWHEPQNDVDAFDNATEQKECQDNSTYSGLKGTAGTPAQYKAMWANVENIFKQQGVTNAVWAMDYQGAPNMFCLIPILWPGNNLVDWVLYDTYDHDDKAGSTWANTAGRVYSELQQFSSSTVNFDSKPWGLGEFGTCGNVSPTNTQQYFQDADSAYKAGTYPKLDMYLVYADNGNNSGQGCFTDYDSNPSNPKVTDSYPTISKYYDTAKQNDFNELFDNILSTGGGPVPSTSITSPASGATVSGSSVSVSAKASVSSATITKLVVSAAGTTLKSCSASPCSATWNTTSATNGSQSVTTTATASDGETNTTSENVTVKNGTTVTISSPNNVVSPSQTTSTINLSWDASSDSAYPASDLTYTVYRNGDIAGTTAAGSTSYNDKSLTAGTYYSYTIVAKDPGGHTSTTSAPFTQETKVPNCALPKAPAGLTGSVPDPTSVVLNWQTVPNPSTGCVITGYLVSRNTVPIASPPTNSYKDTSVTANTTYSYDVLATETGGTAGASSNVKVTTPQSTQPDPGPSSPSNLKGVAISTSQINMTWTASSDTVTGIKQYNILRNGVQVGTTTSGSFGDSGLNANTANHYQVVAVSGGNKTASSSTISVTTLSNSQPGNVGGGQTSPSSTPSPLQGTHSVGYGSEKGTSQSINPTAPGNTTTTETAGSGSSHTETQTKQKSKSDTIKNVAYVGSSLIGIVLVVGALIFWGARRKATHQWVKPADIDIQPADTVIHTGETNESQHHNDDKGKTS